MTERFTVIIAQESHSKYGYLEKERQTVEIEIDLADKNKTLQDYCLDAAIKLGFSSYVNIKDQLEFRKPNTGVMKGDVIELHEMEPNAKYLLCLVSNEVCACVLYSSLYIFLLYSLVLYVAQIG